MFNIPITGEEDPEEFLQEVEKHVLKQSCDLV